MDTMQDDGSLAFLGITKNDRDKRFTCKEEQQSNLVNKTFWVLDYFSGTASYGSGSALRRLSSDTWRGYGRSIFRQRKNAWP